MDCQPADHGIHPIATVFPGYRDGYWKPAQKANHGKWAVNKYHRTLRGLLVGCDKETAGQIGQALEEEGMTFSWTETPPGDLNTAMHVPCSLFVVDFVMPSNVKGQQLLQKFLQNMPDIPTLFLVADKEPSTIVTALEAGADDVLAKPFAGQELAARVRALLRRRFGFQSKKGDEIVCGELRLDPVKRRAWRASTEISLTRWEHALLKYFMLHPNVALSRSQIRKDVWRTEQRTFANTIDVYVTHLRKKLEVLPNCSRIIETVRGVGYMLKADEHRAG